LILKHFSIVYPPHNSFSASKRNRTVTNPSSLYLHPDHRALRRTGTCRHRLREEAWDHSIFDAMHYSIIHVHLSICVY